MSHSVDASAAATDFQTPDAASLLRARYRSAIPAEGPWNEVIAGLLSHRSVRSYLPTPLPAGTLETLVAAAQSAASSSNLQTWSVIAVEDPERKARLSRFAGSQRHIEQSPLFLVWLADLSRLERIAQDRHVETEGLAYLESLIVAVVDAALAAQNAVVAAESLGLSTVYIGAIRNHPEQVAAELRLPAHVLAAFGLCVGYASPDAVAEIKPRLPQDVVLHRETYSTANHRSEIEAYDAGIREFYRAQGVDAPGWIETVLKRVQSGQALNGRQHLRTLLNGLGFELR